MAKLTVDLVNHTITCSACGGSVTDQDLYRTKTESIHSAVDRFVVSHMCAPRRAHIAKQGTRLPDIDDPDARWRAAWARVLESQAL